MVSNVLPLSGFNNKSYFFIISFQISSVACVLFQRYNTIVSYYNFDSSLSFTDSQSSKYCVPLSFPSMIDSQQILLVLIIDSQISMTALLSKVQYHSTVTITILPF